jgi:murein DD-endopeptidase MepM/ murein hydrolase activator NlpD
VLRARLKAATRLNVTVVLLAALVAVGFVGEPASGSGDDHGLHSRRHRLDNKIATQKSDVDDISSQLLRAQARLNTTVARLAASRARLADLRTQVRVAERVDRRTRARLAQAVLRLRTARTDLARGRADLGAMRKELTGYAVSSYSSGSLTVSGLGMSLSPGSAREVVNGLQDADSVMNKQAVGLQRLQAMQVLLTLTEKRVRGTKDDVAQRRREAADNLASKRSLEAAARAAWAQVQRRVARLRADGRKLASAKTAEIRRLHALTAERQRVEQRLRQVAERRARQHHKSLAASSTAPTTAPTTVTHNDGGYLSYPVRNTYITSPYGMRMHPILHVWKLHDGTDFHADCGTPVYAAADGSVTDEYFNAGYGNRLLMDNGYVHGVSLATSYNHLTSFVAGVGAHVQRGQLIAYSGTTGYSTACHLHFMVYVNGATVDPMTWL